MTGRAAQHTKRAITAIALSIGLALPASAQHEHPEAPEHTLVVELSPSVRRAIDAPWASEEEKAALRVFHGVWRSDDLQGDLRAQAALIAGVWDDPSLDDPSNPPEVNAEAMLARGDLESALRALDTAQSVRAARIRAEALEGLGRFEEADAAVEPAAQVLQSRGAQSAEELVEGVRALRIRARLRGEPARNYQQMMALLGTARQNDQLYWPATTAEADLLIAKDNREEALGAIQQALAMNPKAADAWAMLGELMVGGFDFATARMAAGRLDALARELSGDPHARHPLGAIVRARAWLRQREPALVREELEPVRERFPRHRETIALLAAAAAVENDGASLESLLAEHEELSPGSPLALFEVGAALSEARQYDIAAEYLERASRRQPNWPPPLVELGLLELQSGRDLRARDALREVARLDPFHRRAANSLKMIEDLLSQFETIESEHFIVRYRPGVDEVMAREMLPRLEEMHEVVAGVIDHEPDRKTMVELMPDHQWFAVRITGMPAIHTIAAATGPVIAMEAPKIGPNHSGEYDWVRVLRHEYTHTVTLSRTRYRIPHWFTEASAVHLELSPRGYDTCRLLVSALKQGELFDLRAINIAFVRPEKPTDRSQAYAQGHWMYEYIVERWGERAPLDLMDQYAEGAREPAAFERVLGVTTDEFFEGFVEWAHAQAQSWGLLPEVPVGEMVARALSRDERGSETLGTALRGWGTSFALTTAGAIAPEPPILELPPPTSAQVNEWLREHPGHPGLLEYRMGYAVREAGGSATEEIAPLIEEYAAARPVDPAPHRLLASLYLRSDDPMRAAPHLEYLDAREQHSAAFAAALAKQYATSSATLDRAAEKAERATTIAPFDAENRELAARVALLRREYATAERHLEALIAIEPDREVHRQRLERLRELQAQASAG